MVPMRMYLTGFMGSGKSTLGPLLAKRYDYRFIDLDTMIEQEAGQPIRTIFQERGEAVFRAMERTALEQVATQENTIIAVGGGALTYEHNLRLALGTGTVIYLHVSAEVLVQRLARQATLRPLLQDHEGRVLSQGAMKEKIQTMLQQRAPYYERAQHIVHVGGLTIAQAFAAVEEQLASA